MGRTLRLRKQKKRQQRQCQEKQQGEEFQMDCDTSLEDGKHNIKSLYKYLVTLGWKNETNLKLYNFPLTGRGLYSKTLQKIMNGTILIRLPSNCLITLQTIENDNEFKENFINDRFTKDCKISFQALMAFYVLYHYKTIKQNSPILAYLETLPKQFSVPYFCTKAELKYLPDIILEQTVKQNRLIKEAYQHLKNVYKHCNFEDVYSLEEYRWSYFVVNTRSVYINSKHLNVVDNFFKLFINDNINMALAPFLDFFNHSDSVKTQAELVCSANNETLELIITLSDEYYYHQQKSTQQRQQLFISYGCLTNFELLTEYGFTIANNLYDYFLFTLNDIENFLQSKKKLQNDPVQQQKQLLLHRNKFKFIRNHNLMEQMFLHKDDGISYNLHVVLHILFKEDRPYTNILNQVAYGTSENLLPIDSEIIDLIKYKILEYETYQKALQKINHLSQCGQQVVKYMKESVNYLKIYLQNNTNLLDLSKQM